MDWCKKGMLKEYKLEKIGEDTGLHIAFLAPNTESVHKWHRKCLLLGGQDNGAPGPQAQYHPHYYGAFIVDPDGCGIEACFQEYEKNKKLYAASHIKVKS